MASLFALTALLVHLASPTVPSSPQRKASRPVDSGGAVVAAIILDALVLVSMLARVGEFGFTANRVAALGLNLILLVNLVVTAWLVARLLIRRSPAARLERWQTGYLPVFGAWVALVVLALPPVFGFA